MEAKKIYLVLYNCTLFIGWSAILVMMFSAMFYSEHGDGNSLPHLLLSIYLKVETLLKISQTAAVLEILHCLVKIVPSSPILTGFQVLSRLFVLWFVTDLVPSTQEAPGVIMYLICWTVTEIIRYSYYVMNLVGSAPYVIMWCRYTFFFVLYPVGVAGELITIYHALSVVKKTGILSFALPNAINFGFSYYIFLIFVMLCYIPIFPQLFFHMIAQRRKFIGAKAKKVE